MSFYKIKGPPHPPNSRQLKHRSNRKRSGSELCLTRRKALGSNPSVASTAKVNRFRSKGIQKLRHGSTQWHVSQKSALTCQLSPHNKIIISLRYSSRTLMVIVALTGRARLDLVASLRKMLSTSGKPLVVMDSKTGLRSHPWPTRPIQSSRLISTMVRDRIRTTPTTPAFPSSVVATSLSSLPRTCQQRP